MAEEKAIVVQSFKESRPELLARLRIPDDGTLSLTQVLRNHFKTVHGLNGRDLRAAVTRCLKRESDQQHVEKELGPQSLKLQKIENLIKELKDFVSQQFEEVVQRERLILEKFDRLYQKNATGQLSNQTQINGSGGRPRGVKIDDPKHKVTNRAEQNSPGSEDIFDNWRRVPGHFQANQ